MKYPQEPGTKIKQLGITLNGEHEITLRSEDYPTKITVGVYPSDKSEMYIKTANGTYIRIEQNGRVTIAIPPTGAPEVR